MPRGFAADKPTALVQLFQHITVAHFGAGKGDAARGKGFFHAQIAHHRADHAAEIQALRGAGFGDDVNQFVAVVHHAVFVHHHQAVAVAVQRDAVIRIVLQHGGLQRFGVGGAYFVVDVVAVGFVANADDFRAQLVEYFGRGVVACAVGGIHHQFQAV